MLNKKKSFHHVVRSFKKKHTCKLIIIAIRIVQMLSDTPVAFQTHEKIKWSCFAVILLGRWRMRYKIGYLISPKVNRY